MALMTGTSPLDKSLSSLRVSFPSVEGGRIFGPYVSDRCDDGMRKARRRMEEPSIMVFALLPQVSHRRKILVDLDR